MKRLALLIASAATLFVADAVPLAARAGTCSTGNAGRWCAHQDSLGGIGTALAGDRFGAAVALFGSALADGDLDGDGSDEVVIGVPDAPVGGNNAAGIVYVTRAFDPAFLFVDGFEDDATASWSAVVP